MLIKQACLCILGLCSGFSVAAGVFAFITMVGIVPRLAARTGTASHIYLYERMIFLGGTLGNIWILYRTALPLSVVFLCVYGVFSGIFVGCLAMALAEVLRVFPILTSRLNIREGFPLLPLAAAIGKLAGTLLQSFG